MARFPKDNQNLLIEFYGDPGRGEVSKQLVPVVPPFRVTYEGKPFPKFMVHKKCATEFTNALNKIWDYYGRDQATLDKLRISTTAGTYAPRKVRGSDTKWSNHAYGSAVDINSEQNGFGTSGANMPRPVVAAFKSEGFSWGGDYKGRTDPMHFEAVDRGEPTRTFDEWLTYYKMPTAATPASVAVSVPKPEVVSPLTGLRQKMASTIISYEARRDAQGRLTVYSPSDGSIEVAGVNSTYHPELTKQLQALLTVGKHAEAERVAGDFILNYTNFVTKWHEDAGVEFYLRDCAYNRGPTGAAKILQTALGFTGSAVDGDVGPKTRAKIKSAVDPDPLGFLDSLRSARQIYEKTAIGKRAAVWAGLVNRWDNSLRDAKEFHRQGKSLSTPLVAGGALATGVFLAGGTATVVESTTAGASVSSYIAMALFIAVVIMVGYFMFKSRRSGNVT